MRKSSKQNIKNNNNINKKNLSKRRNKRKNIWLQIILLLGVVIAIFLLSVKPDFHNYFKKQSILTTEIKFKKEGQLNFYDQHSNVKITTIDIEIAEDNYERAMGLMNRYSMSDSVGMLFIMEKEEPQSFWMKNTYISLDIIYLNKDLKIVKIQKYTQPLSEHPIPSIKKSKYVVEVIGGLCNMLMIEEGDYITYEKQLHTTKYK
jgi:hypothetical protein